MLIEKSVTENGEYNASDDNADGYSKVNVDVPSSGGNDPFIIDIEESGTYPNYTYSTTKTSDEINAAIASNKDLVAVVTVGTSRMYLKEYLIANAYPTGHDVHFGLVSDRSFFSGKIDVDVFRIIANGTTSPALVSNKHTTISTT